MASSSSSVPPSNPFDGFDSYSTVAAPAMTATTQQQPPPPSQYPQQPQQQQPSSPTPQMHQEWQRPVAAMASPYFAAQMLPMPGMSPQPQQQPVQPQQQQQQQELVPAAPSAMSPWALSPNPPPSAGQLTASNAFPPQQQHPISMDPFAVQLPMQQQQQQLVPQPQYQQQLLSPQYQIPPPQMPPQQQSTTPQQRLHNELQGFFNDETPQNKPSVLPDETEEEGLGLIDVELDDDENNTSNNNHTNNERRKADGEFFGKHQHHQHSSSSSPLRDKYADIAPPPPITPARHHAEYLAQQTTRTPSSGSITSPLPQPSLVLHSGYVLSRISFRTVLLRKWKQTFWIQYGPTQLLFFRSFADYEDWLNNPYHSQRARDFLIKLRVDFVSDLKKTSVMGYQVTQIRRKPYGKNVMLHFKLERWMDYGPTIAAAFAAREEEMVHSPTHRSNTNRRRGGGGNDNDDDDDDGDNFMNTTNDVASLRKIILGCMRNARDAALVASRGSEAEDMYRGRYNNEGGDYNSSASAGVGGIMNDRSGTVNMGYHQAFSAESTPRRRMDMDEIKENNNSSSAEKSSVKTEESAEATTTMAPPAAITNGVVDLLG